MASPFPRNQVSHKLGSYPSLVTNFQGEIDLSNHLVFHGSLFACQCSKDIEIYSIFRSLPALQFSDYMNREVVLNYTIHLFTESYF